MNKYIKKGIDANYSYIKTFQYNDLSELYQKNIDEITNVNLIDMNDVVLFEDYPNLPKKRVEGAIFDNEDCTYVVFMASNSREDWLTNLNFFKKKKPYNNINPKIKAHRGFINRYTLNSVRTKILLELSKRENRKVIVTGYSMGGCLSPICSLDIQVNFPEKEVYCVAFAGARIGNKHFIDSFARKVPNHILAIYGNDFVTKVPPKIFGFRHIPNVIHFGPKRVWWKLSLKDHLPSNLYNKLSAYQNGKDKNII